MTESENELPATHTISRAERDVVLRDPSELIGERQRKANMCLKIQDLNLRKSCPNICEDVEEASILKKAEQMRIKEQTIKHNPPGINMLDPSETCCLFNTGSLSLSDFGVTSHRSFGRFILQLSNERLHKAIIEKTFQSMICSPEMTNAVCRYLFFLMSVHEDEVLVEACLNHLANHKDCFTPTVNDVLTVFINWGCKLNVHCPDLPFEIPGFIRNPELAKSRIGVFYNMKKVLHYLCWMMSTATLTFSDVKCLLRVFLLTALDNTFFTSSAFGKCLDCIHILLDRVTRDNWPDKKIMSLIKVLHFKDTHFHNQANVCLNLLGTTKEGIRISRILAFAMLQQMLHQPNIQYVKHFDVTDLWKLMQNKSEIDSISLYELYFVLKLLHYSICMLPDEPKNKEYLEYFHTWMCDVSGRVPNDAESLDPTLVTELICLMISSWRLKKMNIPSQDYSEDKR